MNLALWGLSQEELALALVVVVPVVGLTIAALVRAWWQAPILKALKRIEDQLADGRREAFERSVR